MHKITYDMKTHKQLMCPAHGGMVIDAKGIQAP